MHKTGSLVFLVSILLVVGLVQAQNTSNTTNTTSPPKITVISPNGGESWQLGSTQTITWTSSGVNYVMLDLVDTTGNLKVTNLVNVQGNPGSASWSIPTNIPTGTYKMRISSCTWLSSKDTCNQLQADAYDLSDSTISITAAPTPSPTGPVCVNGPIPGNGACVCNGVTYTTGYCCNGVYSSSTPCSTNAPQCSEGAVPSSGCLCSGYAYTSGNCCRTALQSGLVWAGNTPCTQTCPTIAKSVSSSYSGVCCGGSASDCKGTWSGQWATDCQGYVCCIGTAQPLCTGSAYGDGAPSPTPTPIPAITTTSSPVPNQTNYTTSPSPTYTPTYSPSPTYTTTPTYSPFYPTPTYSPTPKSSVSCNTDQDCSWLITNGCPENAGASWACSSLLQSLPKHIPGICPQGLSQRPQANCGCVQNTCSVFEREKPIEPPRKIGNTEFDTTKLLAVVIQIEQLKVKFEFLKSATTKLANYYNTTNNQDSATRWLQASQLLQTGIDKLESLKDDIRSKIDSFTVEDLRATKQEIKSVIEIIRDVVKTILAPPSPTPPGSPRSPGNETNQTNI